MGAGSKGKPKAKRHDDKPKRTDVGYKRPPKEHQIKKGEVRNPLGCNSNPEKRLLRTITEKTIAEAIQTVFSSNDAECVALLNDPEITLGHKVILRAAIDAAQNGNYTKFNEILERVLGRVPMKHDLTTKGEAINVSPKDQMLIKAIISKVKDDV